MEGNEFHVAGGIVGNAPLAGTAWLVGRFCCRGGGNIGEEAQGPLEAALPARKLHVLPCYKFSKHGGCTASCLGLRGDARGSRAFTILLSYPFIPPRVGINCYSCLRRVINCRNLSCAGIIAAGLASKFPREPRNRVPRKERFILHTRADPRASSVFYASPLADAAVSTGIRYIFRPSNANVFGIDVGLARFMPLCARVR